MGRIATSCNVFTFEVIRANLFPLFLLRTAVLFVGSCSRSLFAPTDIMFYLPQCNFSELVKQREFITIAKAKRFRSFRHVSEAGWRVYASIHTYTWSHTLNA